jgi:hypothetical protein
LRGTTASSANIINIRNVDMLSSLVGGNHYLT